MNRKRGSAADGLAFQNATKMIAGMLDRPLPTEMRRRLGFASDEQEAEARKEVQTILLQTPLPSSTDD